MAKRKLTAQHKKAISEGMKKYLRKHPRKQLSEAHRHAISEGMKRYYASETEEHRQHRRDALHDYHFRAKCAMILEYERAHINDPDHVPF